MKKFLNILIIILIIFYTIYYWCIPALISIDSRKNLIHDIVKQESGIDIDYINPKLKMGLFEPSVYFEASEFSAADKGLVIKNPKLQVKLLPLLTNKISLKKFSAEEINANIHMDKDKNIYIGNFLVKPVDKNVEIEVSDARLYKYNIRFDDKYNKKDIKLSGKYFELKQDTNITFSAIGDLDINNAKSGVNISMQVPKNKDYNNLFLSGYITNLDLSSLSPYIIDLTKNEVEKLEGIINLQASRTSAHISSEKFFIKVKSLEKPVYLRNKAIIDAKFNIQKNKIELSSVNIVSKGINATIDGVIEDLKNKIPTYNINFALKDTRSELAIPLIPYMNFLECDINLKKLRDYLIYADVNGKINIKGNDIKPDINGSFIAKNVYVERPLNIPKATVKLDFKDKKVYFDAFAPASTTQNVTVKGNVELYDKRMAEIDIKSTSAVDLKTAQIILNPLHEILDFEIGPVPIMDIKGIGNIKLRVKGNKINPHLWGAFNFKNGTVSFNGVNAVIKNASGRLDFNDELMSFTTKKAFLNNVPIDVKGTCNTKGVLNFKVISNGQSLNETLKLFNTSPMLSYISKPTQMFKAGAGKINININLKGQMLHIADFEMGKTIIPSGNIKLLNNEVIIGSSIFKLKNIIGNIAFNNKDMDFNISPLIDNQRINISGKIKDGKVYSKNRLSNINLNIKDSNIYIKDGEVNVNGDKIIVKKLDSLIDSKPTLIDGDISNIYTNPKFDMFISSYPTQQFIDKYINKKMIYPFILKGDMDYNTRISGTLDSLNLRGTVNMQKGASIYYKGAIIDANEFPIKINYDLTALKNNIYLKKFQYSKITENNVPVGLLNSYGKIKVKGGNFVLDNFRIVTQNPTDARIFNIVFKKLLIKEGLFTSDIIINGNMNTPEIFGVFNVFGVNAPFLDTTIKDINVVFKNKTADLRMKGEIFSNEITLDANVKNDFNPPYVINKANLYLGNFDVNTFLKHIDKLHLENFDNVETLPSETNFDIRNLTIKELNIKAKSVLIRNLFAKDFDALISLNKGIFNLEKINFVTAEGIISGTLNYNFNNSKMVLSLFIDKINANTMSNALFDINDQIYGDLNGEVILSCDGKSHEDCMKTLNGNCKFSVLNGKMPKLGSLEYLLKSSNVIKSGVTGLTLNNIIEILTPLKSGEFESIKGMFAIENGKTNDISIGSKGKDLSIFISGDYDFSTSETSLEVYGRLAKKISNGLGIIGNLSLNTLFNTIPGVNLSKTNKDEFVQLINKIPGIELNTNDYRIFFVKLDGNMNTETYHQIFKWID